MDKSRVTLLWVALGAGALLLYAAYKGKSPTGILEGYVTDAKNAETSPGAPVTGSASANIAGAAPVTSETAADAATVPDADGISQPVPAAYAGTPGTYIPPRNSS